MPATLDKNTSMEVFALLQTVWAVGVTVIIGVGLTVMLLDCCGPIHEFAVGVIVMVALEGVVPLFVAINVEITFPVPEARRPIEGLELVQV